MPINIPLLDGWRIKSDSRQYILIRDQKNREINEGFFLTLEGAVQEFADRKIRGFNSTNINSLILAVKSLQARLSRALQGTQLKVEVKKCN